MGVGMGSFVGRYVDKWVWVYFLKKRSWFDVLGNLELGKTRTKAYTPLSQSRQISSCVETDLEILLSNESTQVVPHLSVYRAQSRLELCES